MKYKSILVSCFFLLTSLLWAEGSTSDLARMLNQARAARDKENYQVAVKTYQDVRKLFPKAAEGARELGNLYLEQKLYKLSLVQFQSLITLAPLDKTAYLSLGETLAQLDENTKASQELEKANKLFPQDPDILQTLGWLYYKTGKNRVGVDLIEKVKESKVENTGLEMTLGTLYSGLYDYEKARGSYEKAIQLAPASDHHFKAIAWYNLALLEKSFLHFERSLDAINHSLAEEERPSGLIALGELHQSRLEYAQALEAFEKGARTDDTPLSLFDIADLSRKEGHLDQSSAFVKQMENRTDNSWIYNYGVTKSRFERDLSGLQKDIWTAKANAIDFTPRENPWEWVVWGINKLGSSVNSWYYDQKYKNQQIKLAQEALKAGNEPEAWTCMVLANQDHPSVAKKYLEPLQNFELPKNPLNRGTYLLEWGKLNKDPDTLKLALKTFTLDQGEDRVTALLELAKIYRLKGQPLEQWYPMVNQAYLLQPGALLGDGFALPSVLKVYGTDKKKIGFWLWAVEAFAGNICWDVKAKDRPGVDFELDVNVGVKECLWFLRDAKGKTLREGTFLSEKVTKTTPKLLKMFHAIHDPSPGF